ncbi:MAG: hypothetical protein ABJR05_06725 [Balneola sp.]
MYSNPLSKTQERLRGEKASDMTDEQLLDWIDACDKMEKAKKMPPKARRSWKESRQEAFDEIEKRKVTKTQISGAG